LVLIVVGAAPAVAFCKAPASASAISIGIQPQLDQTAAMSVVHPPTEQRIPTVLHREMPPHIG
jgi:hypothetical protein